MAQAVNSSAPAHIAHPVDVSKSGVDDRTCSVAKEGIKAPSTEKPLSSDNVSKTPMLGEILTVLVGLFQLLTYQPLWEGVAGALGSVNKHFDPEQASDELKKPMKSAKQVVDTFASKVTSHAEYLEKLGKVTTDDVVLKVAEKVQELGVDKMLARGFLNSVAGEAEKVAYGFLKKTCQVPKQFISHGFQLAKSAALNFFGGSEKVA
jgi:hypothetical protein